MDFEAANQIFFRCVEDCFEPIMLTDRRGLLRYVNPAWSLVYGYSKEEAIGQTPRLLRSPEQSDEFYKQMWGTILNPRVGFWRGEVTNVAKDGHAVPVLLTITPYRETTGEVVGYMGIAVDLTEQKSMSTQILRQDRLASIGLLAGGLAHEIGNPLGVIQGRAEMLLSSIEGNAEAEKNVSIIMGQIDRISKLITSLLRVSRVPDKILLREVELKPIVDEVSLLMSETLRRNQIDLRTSDLSGVVSAEPNYLQQLFLNLLINAVHAIEEQRLSGEPSEVVAKSETASQANAQADSTHSVAGRHFIEISSKQVAGLYEISVRDSGCGIRRENLAKLFQPFFTTKAAGKGTGMGLAIVSKLVEEMQGEISVTSEGPNHGATFKIRMRAP